jgi:hypothetical protein
MIMKPDYKALSKRLTTIQFPNTRTTASRLVDNEHIIEEYLQRTYATRGKITKVLRPFEIGQAYNDSVRNLLGWLQDAIGVYNIHDFLNGGSYPWHKVSSVNPDVILQGTGWPQYLGDPSIQNGGGRVVVVLSDEGVKWLNEIADKVKSYIPVDIPTTNPTKEKSEGEILDEEVKKLIEQFDTYLYEDDTDWSIGTKLIQQFWDPTEKPDIVRSLWED